MPSSRAPTVRQRRLGAALRQLRDSAGLSSQQVGSRLGWSASKVSRLETGRTGAHESDIGRLLELYGPDERQRGELLALARDAEQTGWWADYPEIRDDVAAFIALEDEADSAYYMEAQVIPGLLQTKEYARHVIQGWNVLATLPPQTIERHIEVRMRRQRVLDPPHSLRISVVLDESALLRRIGDAGIMARQLDHLVNELARPNVTLQVLPLDGLHEPVLGESFILFDFPVTNGFVFPTALHTESLITTDSQDETVIHMHRLAFKNLAAHSLSQEESIEIIRAARIRWSAQGPRR
jgi:transcriptional regulator with XRE-family HTH domain